MTGSDFPMAHGGLGAHPDVSVALRRALTEPRAIQMAVDIQGVREDMSPPGAGSHAFGLHTRRISNINRESWCLGESKRKRKLAAIPSNTHASIDEDMKFLLDSFVACGLDQIVVVDFTPHITSYSVVRVIVPGIELWGHFDHELGVWAVEPWPSWKENA